MTFEELLEEITHDYLNPPTSPDNKLDADKNGHTRLADLQRKYNLSSLKIQKLLVTAGVYQPVKIDSGYYAVNKLHAAGKTVDEIRAATGLSKAAVNAFLPYKRGAKSLDKLGVEISDDAARKRKQRSVEEMKKENARELLAETMTDEALWNALGEHFTETFISTSGQRFAINVVYTGGEDLTEKDPSIEKVPELAISKSGEEDIIYIPQEDVFDTYHKALEEKAGEDVSLGAYEEYLRPVFIFLGVLDGDRSATTTKRSEAMIGTCDCCGKKTEHLFTVSTFEDLIKLDRQFEKEREACQREEEKEQSGIVDFKMIQEREYWKKQKEKKLAAACESKAVESFNMEGDRKFCKLCCQTIFDALEEGLLPPASQIGRYDDLSDDDLRSFILEECKQAKCDYFQAFGEIYRATEFDNHSLFLYKVRDNKGVEHSFALTVERLPYEEGDMGLGFKALEVHKLTKAGKIARDNTDTDYDIWHFKMCREGEDFEHKTLVGVAELIEKIRNTVRSRSLSESHYPIGNGITINGHHYGVESIGTIVPTYVDNAKNYRSMKGREWDGGEYGFMIDGKLFSGEELALMFSCFEGWQVKFYADDPNSQPLRTNDFLMQVQLSQKDLVDELIELINMMTTGGKFEREKDKENFEKLFRKTVFEKFRLYNNSRPRGYGKLAGMEIIKKLMLIEGTEQCRHMVQAVLR